MAKYYARYRVPGVGGMILDTVNTSTTQSAKQLIQAKHPGKRISYYNGPQKEDNKGRPPSWYK